MADGGCPHIPFLRQSLLADRHHHHAHRRSSGGEARLRQILQNAPRDILEPPYSAFGSALAQRGSDTLKQGPSLQVFALLYSARTSRNGTVRSIRFARATL
jgi:hypothetical protein